LFSFSLETETLFLTHRKMI